MAVPTLTLLLMLAFNLTLSLRLSPRFSLRLSFLPQLQPSSSGVALRLSPVSHVALGKRCGSRICCYSTQEFRTATPGAASGTGNGSCLNADA
ncbi:hypothetical protein ACLKA7_009957 [Drosophila subpalustris]